MRVYALKPEFLAKVKTAYIRIVDDLFRTAFGQDLPGIDDVGAVGQAERFPHIMVGNQHADAPIAVGDIQDLVRHLTNRGIGVLITDHNVRETLGLTDRAYIVYAGQILTEGSPEEIVNDPDVRRLYLGEEFRL